MDAGADRCSDSPPSFLALSFGDADGGVRKQVVCLQQHKEKKRERKKGTGERERARESWIKIRPNLICLYEQGPVSKRVDKVGRARSAEVLTNPIVGKRREKCGKNQKGNRVYVYVTRGYEDGRGGKNV